MAIEQFGKITYDDINNLKNESITTKNIYASGTSATIGTSDNPFNTVYANTYYGRLSERTLSYSLLYANGYFYEGATLSDSIKNYTFILVYSKWGNATVTSMVIPTYPVDGSYNHYSNTYWLDGYDSYTYQRWSFCSDGKTIAHAEVNNTGWTWVIGFKGNMV